MSFYIKNFRLTPQALERNDAVPDKTQFTIETDVICLKHGITCLFNFIYYAGEVEIANSFKDCSGEVENHFVKDEVVVTSDKWGSGTISEVQVMAVVTHEGNGESKDIVTSTWVEE